jgi:truncated hemoglobin YjbI
MPACGDDGGGEDGSTTNPSTSTPMTSTAPTTGDAPTTGEMTTGDTACTVDICMTYGAAVPKVSSDITDQAAADPMFMADFAPLVAAGPAAVQAFKDSLAAFISDAYGCTTGAYTGPTMEAAHAGLAITQSEYDAFIGLIAGVLSSNGVPDADIQNCFAPPLVDPAFAATIIGK